MLTLAKMRSRKLDCCKNCSVCRSWIDALTIYYNGRI